MLGLTRKTDYALVALAYLGQVAGRGQLAASARQIGDAFGIPLPALMNVLKDLARARLVQSTRGAGGGYSLAVAPGQIAVIDVVTAIEGPMRFARCANDLPVLGQDCSLSQRCPIHGAIHRLHQRLHGFLEEVTLADLMAQSAGPRVPLGAPGVRAAV